MWWLSIVSLWQVQFFFLLDGSWFQDYFAFVAICIVREVSGASPEQAQIARLCLHRVAPLVPNDDETDVTLEALTNSDKLEGEASPSLQIDGSQSSTEGKQRFRAQPQSPAPSSLQTADGADFGKDRLDIWCQDVLIGLRRVVTC